MNVILSVSNDRFIIYMKYLEIYGDTIISDNYVVKDFFGWYLSIYLLKAVWHFANIVCSE